MQTLPQFTVGETYSRQEDIHKKFGGNRQSGIASSSQVPAIFLFTGDSGLKFGYRDSPEASDYCDYVGEGQVGDMTFTAGNKAIRDHVQEGKALHLFKALGKSKPYRYLGEFALASYSTDVGSDREFKQRQIIVFHLVRVKDAVVDESVAAQERHAVQEPPSITAARALALAACKATAGVEGKQALINYYERSQAVRRYALLRAKGSCEACSEPAPFIGKQGEPYLEVHHTTRLSDGGIDHPRNVAALCPTCHREIHCGANGAEKNDRLRALIRQIEV
jgi:5-methylcytosine-specific restriction protein A